MFVACQDVRSEADQKSRSLTVISDCFAPWTRLIQGTSGTSFPQFSVYM